MQNISLLGRYGIYLLVLLSVVLFVYIIITLIQTMSMEYADRRIKEDRAAGLSNGVYFFISRSMLMQVQLSCGILLTGILIGILMCCKVYSPVVIVPAGAGMFAIGALAPWMHFHRKALARALLFESAVLELARGFTSGLKAGLALPQALETFARRCEGPMKDELKIVLREYRLGQELADAMQRMYDRIPCEDLQLLVVSIRLTTQSGGSMVDVLEKITAMIQGRSDFQKKLRGLTAQGRFEALAMSLAPLAAFLLLFVTNNDLMWPLVTTAIGWCAIGIMLLLELVGYFAIRAIVDIKV